MTIFYYFAAVAKLISWQFVRYLNKPVPECRPILGFVAARVILSDGKIGNDKLCWRPPQYPPTTFDILTFNLVSESRVRKRES